VFPLFPFFGRGYWGWAGAGAGMGLDWIGLAVTKESGNPGILTDLATRAL